MTEDLMSRLVLRSLSMHGTCFCLRLKLLPFAG